MIGVVTLATGAVGMFWIQLNNLRRELQKERVEMCAEFSKEQDEMRSDFNHSRESQAVRLEALSARVQAGFDNIGQRYATRDDFMLLRNDMAEIGRKIDSLMRDRFHDARTPREPAAQT
jgi:hypothetical protein